MQEEFYSHYVKTYVFFPITINLSMEDEFCLNPIDLHNLRRT